MGRPSLYTDELAENILDRLSNGESMVQICSGDDMPGLRTVMRWVGENDSFGTEYVRAREAQAEVMDDKILTAATSAKEDPQAARVQIEAYKWRAAKLAPKKYGDAMLHKHADADGEKIALGEVESLTRLAALASKLQERLGDTDNSE